MRSDTVHEPRARAWRKDTVREFLRAGVHPVRSGYMRSVLVDDLGMDPRSLRVLDVGCCDGYFAEEFARLGFQVTGVDPCARSLEAARRRAAAAGLDIDYRHGAAEALPVPDTAFDVVHCCDLLEHVTDIDALFGEIARSLKPSGVFLYDTINRTRRSRMLWITISQDWKATAWAEPRLHDWDRFIRPAELDESMQRAGLHPKVRVGFTPRSMVVALLAFRARAKGRIDHGEMGTRLRLRITADLSCRYGGWATKEAS